MDVVKTYKTLRLRVKDKHAGVLRAMARDVNTVFNYCNETSARAIRDRARWLSSNELQKLTAGFSRCDGVTISAKTIAQVCDEYTTRRIQFKKARLHWRVSNRASAKYSLGWIPFKIGTVKYKAGQVTYHGRTFSLWDSYGLSKYELRGGSFSEDARGRWYLNVAVEVEGAASQGKASVGIDLGLKDCVTTSDGEKLVGRWFRESEAALAIAQRARKKDRTRAIHAKIRNRRKDDLHKFSTLLTRRYAAIFVGDVSSVSLTKTTMAKSTLDAGWSQFKMMLEYKSHLAGVIFEEVNEAYTTQTCSQCASIEGPEGLKDLGMRQWACSCGAVHDRDINAARNIAARGLARLVEGTPARAGG